MYDWNKNGKIDAEDHAFTAFMIHNMDHEDRNGGKPGGCCGPTAAMLLIGVALPAIITAVFLSHHI